MLQRNLESLLQNCESSRFAVIGDVMLDRYVWGAVERISPEAPIPIVEELRREDCLGGAANVVNNLLGLQCNVDVFGVVGVDLEGSRVLEILRERGVRCEGLVREEMRTTTTKTRILGGAQQLVRLDRELRSPLKGVHFDNLLAVFESRVREYKGIIISDYGKGVVSRDLLQGLKEIVSNDVPIIIDPHPANYNEYLPVFLVKPNKKEAENAARMTISDVESGFVACEKLLERWGSEYVLITLGSMGMLMLNRAGTVKEYLKTRARQVYDVSGAGDTVTSVIGAGLVAGLDVVASAEVANHAAGIVIAEVGTAPITRTKLLRSLV